MKKKEETPGIGTREEYRTPRFLMPRRVFSPPVSPCAGSATIPTTFVIQVAVTLGGYDDLLAVAPLGVEP